ncbi:MAG: hypothetical protein MUF72_21430 [Elainella sp. Prado103]|jgi:hypothetical protein|nr:hypothetical protein [Elainella sp. Prado103]
MKHLGLIAIVTLLPTAALLREAPVEAAPIIQEVSQVDHPSLAPASSRPAVTPNAAPNSGNSTLPSVSVGQDSELVSPDARGERLDDKATQINQSLDRPANNSRILEEFIQLPEGMIIRGSSRGGIGIGREY